VPQDVLDESPEARAVVQNRLPIFDVEQAQVVVMEHVAQVMGLVNPERGVSEGSLPFLRVHHAPRGHHRAVGGDGNQLAVPPQLAHVSQQECLEPLRPGVVFRGGRRSCWPPPTARSGLARQNKLDGTVFRSLGSRLTKTLCWDGRLVVFRAVGPLFFISVTSSHVDFSAF